MIRTEKEPITTLLQEAIKLTRIKKGWTARDVSLQAGLSPSYVSKIESGEIYEPSLQKFYLIAKALEFSDYEILVLVRSFGVSV